MRAAWRSQHCRIGAATENGVGDDDHKVAFADEDQHHFDRYHPACLLQPDRERRVTEVREIGREVVLDRAVRRSDSVASSERARQCGHERVGDRLVGGADRGDYERAEQRLLKACLGESTR